MNAWTWAWLALGAGALVLEFVALFNSREGDTLSEHVWAWTGVRATRGRPAGARIAPVWTVRVARLLVLGFLGWLAVHLTTGWM